MGNIKIKQTTWDLSPLGAGDDDPKFEEKRDISKKKNYDFINKWKDRGDYLKDPSILLEALDEYEELERLYGISADEGYYFSMRSSQDEDNPKLKAKENKLHDFSLKIVNDIQFFGMRVAKIPQKGQKKFLDYKGLGKYKHFLEGLFKESKYLLTEAEEKIMNLTGKASFGNWVDMVSRFVNREEREVLTEEGKIEKKSFNEIMSLSSSTKKEVRDGAVDKVHEITAKHADVAEAEINSILERKKMSDELRGMKRADLGRHLGDDIDTEVVDTLIESVSGRFDIANKYYKLKAKLLGVDKLKYHERNVPYGDLDKKYSYEDSINLVYKVFSSLDKKFADILKMYVEKARIDVYPKKGKTGGAFCAGQLLIQPTYILLNHTDKLRDVLTIAHEVGHGINNELMKECQNSLNFDTPKSTAEVASTFMEDFVLEELAKEADDEQKLAIMMMKLSDDVATIFRQVALYKFEQKLHESFKEKGYLSKEDIGKLFQNHMSAYMGDAIEQSAGSENWWVYWSHIRYFFYVYSYASGLLISKSMQAEVKKDPKFIDKVKEFLSSGTSDSPKNIFLKMGIDITDKKFWERGLSEIENLLNETENLAKKLGKI